MQYYQRFTEEIFSALISLIFILAASKAVIVTFDAHSKEVGFLTAILCFGICALAFHQKLMKKTMWFNPTIRVAMSNFAVITDIVVVTLCPRIFSALLGLGTIIYPIIAATVRSLTHLISVTTYEAKPIPGGNTQSVVAKVVEQRLTNFAIYILMALCLLLSSVLKYVPESVLFGVVLYMGMISIAGNQLFARLFLLGKFDPATYPKFPYVTRPTTKRLHVQTSYFS